MINDLFRVVWLLVLLFFVSAAQESCQAGMYGYEKEKPLRENRQ